MDQELVARAICTATEEVFSTMFGSEVVFEGEPGETQCGLMALVGLTGSWTGAGTLSCTPALGNQVASVMFMSEPVGDGTSIDDDVLDAVAELTNMVIGNIKNILELEVGPMAISIPSVIHGRNFHFRSLTGKTTATVAFRWNGEPVQIKVVLAPSSDQESAGRLRGAVLALGY